jgi:hypothetical protein
VLIPDVSGERSEVGEGPPDHGIRVEEVCSELQLHACGEGDFCSVGNNDTAKSSNGSPACYGALLAIVGVATNHLPCIPSPLA